MNRSPTAFPTILSCTLIASLSMLNMGSAWSAETLQESAKAGKPKVAKAKSSKYKTVRAKAKRPPLAKKAVPLKLQASKELPAALAASTGKVTTNPYYANQPIAILPLAAKTAPLAAAAVAATTAVTTPAAVAVPSQAAQVPSQAEPVAANTTGNTVTASVSAPETAPQSAATEAAVSLPSLNPPIYGQAATAVAVNVRDQASNPPVAVNKNPYLAYQAQPFVLPDPFKLFSLFGSGLKIASPFPQQAYTAPAYNPQAYKAPTYSPPAYTPPAVNAPTFSLPAFSFPAYKAPAYSASSYGSTAYTVPSPAQAAPVAQSAPVVQTAPVAQSTTASASSAVNSLFSSLKMMIPLTGDANILPTIKKVYPTGEKPLVVLNFKCPTEVIGVTPPPMKLLHEAVNLGFDGLNKTNLLSFNLQQVCS